MKAHAISFILFATCILCACSKQNKDTPMPDQNVTAVLNTEAPKQEGTDMDTNSTTPTYHKITDKEAHDMMADSKAYTLLDVRTEEEFNESRIDGAMLIPFDELKDRAAAELTDKDARIFVYCRTGRRSEIAAKELVAMGYTNVYDFGGIVDWTYDTVGTKGSDTK